MIADVRLSCGRWVLYVAEIAVAMEGDPCRQELPEVVAEPIPPEELAAASIGGQPCKDMPLSMVRLFRGERWRRESLQWAAEKINLAAVAAQQPVE